MLYLVVGVKRSNLMNHENRDFKGVWIPKDIWLTKKLKPMEKFFLVEIDSLDNDKGCFASNAHFSELFDVSKGRCTQIIKKLEADGWIKIKLHWKGKLIEKRELMVVNKLTTQASSSVKPVVKKLTRGSEKIKQGYLINAEGNNTKSNKEKEKKKDKRKKTFTLPELINKIAWNEYELHRKEIKKPLSDLARTKATNLLLNYSQEEQQEMVNYSINGSYPALYPPKISNNKKQQPKNFNKTDYTVGLEGFVTE